jgi:hypothetical protein
VIQMFFNPTPWNLVGTYTMSLGKNRQIPQAGRPLIRIGTIMWEHCRSVRVRASRPVNEEARAENQLGLRCCCF